MNRSSVILALVLGLVSVLPSAAAHASLLGSDPRPGARLAAAPSEVAITLTERVDRTGSGIEVLDATGRRVDENDLTIDDAAQPVLRVSIPAGLPSGAYTIHWWAFSSVDQHTTTGNVGFAIGGFDPPATTQSATDALRPAGATARFLQFVGTSLSLGAFVFGVFVDRGPDAASRRSGYRTVFAWGVTVNLAAVVLLLWDTWEASGMSASDFTRSSATPWFALRLSVLLVLVPLAFFARKANDRLEWPLGILFALTLIASSRFGHASQAGALGVIVDYVHLVAVAAWVGGLGLFFVFLVRARRKGLAYDAIRPTGLRFGTLALVCAMIMAASGVLLAFLILGRDALTDPLGPLSHRYGMVLFSKILLAAGMVALGAINRYVFLARREGPARGGLAPVVGAEAILGACTLVLAGVLTSIGAPAPAAGPEDPGLWLQGDGDVFSVGLFFEESPSAGNSSRPRFHLIEAQNGSPVTENTCGRSDCIRLRLSRDEESGAALGEDVRKAVPDGAGWWIADEPFLFVRPGNHTLVIEAQTADVYRDAVAVRFTVG